jgi:hypothetical protein
MVMKRKSSPAVRPLDSPLWTMTDPLSFSISLKKIVQKSVKLPEDLVEEIEAIARENSTKTGVYSFTEVAANFLRQAVEHYRRQHPRTDMSRAIGWSGKDKTQPKKHPKKTPEVGPGAK